MGWVCGWRRGVTRNWGINYNKRSFGLYSPGPEIQNKRKEERPR